MEVIKLLEVIQSVLSDMDAEDFKLKPTLDFSYEKGYLHFLCQLDDSNVIGTPFNELKKDCPLDTTKHMQKHAIGRKDDIFI